MVKQIRLLTRIQLCNLFGWNEFRHTKDRKKKSNFVLLGFVWFFLGIMMIAYVCGISNVLGRMGAQRLIPQLLATAVSIVVLFFNILQAGNVIFQKKAVEMQMSMPVHKAAIVISRFLTIYVTDLLLAIVIMMPGLLCYTAYAKATFAFWFFGIIGMLLVPLLPLTIATIIGAGITAITAKWKHKNAIVTVCTLAVAMGAIGFNMSINNETVPNMEEIVNQIVPMLENRIGNMYPPAVWMNDAITQGNAVAFLMFVGISVGLFVLFVWVLQRHFLNICSALQTSYHNKDFRINNMESSSMLKALWSKELKRYFASSIYVSNTLIGNIMSVALAIAVLVMGTDRIGETLGMGERVVYILPVLLGAVASMTPISTCSISIEGKQWWIVNTLPISKQLLRKAKVLANLSVALPFYVVSGIITLIAIKPNPMLALWVVLIPALYIVFGSYAGLTCNEKFPKFDWENEAEVVKQGLPIILMIFLTVFLAGVPFILLVILPTSEVNGIFAGVAVVLLIATILLSKRK